jgi:hypothetical protein
MPLSKMEKANMLKPKFLIGVALLVPLLGAAIPAEAAKKNATAARAECFKQANAAVTALGTTGANSSGAEKQSAGYDAYVACCKKAGIAP